MTGKRELPQIGFAALNPSCTWSLKAHWIATHFAL